MDTEKKHYPLRLSGVSKSTIWGGSRLKEAYGKHSDGETLAESWDLSCRTPEETCRIENGYGAGMLLSDYLRDYGSALLGTRFHGDRFPLLIKWIDARDRLSVQVHPDDAYAMRERGELGKTEMWYVVEAEEGASLIYGLKEGVTREDFALAVAEGRLFDTMNVLPVKAGDAVFIPAGQLHAIGAGILIAEIQQSSDVTYRVYDYERRDKDGKERPLHVKEALEVVRSFTEEEVNAIRYARVADDERGDPSLLAACPYFTVRRLSVNGRETLALDEKSFLHLLCLSGDCTLVQDAEKHPVARGDSYFLPAGLGDCRLEGEATLLLTTL